MNKTNEKKIIIEISAYINENDYKKRQYNLNLAIETTELENGAKQF